MRVAQLAGQVARGAVNAARVALSRPISILARHPVVVEGPDGAPELKGVVLGVAKDIRPGESRETYAERSRGEVAAALRAAAEDVGAPDPLRSEARFHETYVRPTSFTPVAGADGTRMTREEWEARKASAADPSPTVVVRADGGHVAVRVVDSGLRPVVGTTISKMPSSLPSREGDGLSDLFGCDVFYEHKFYDM